MHYSLKHNRTPSGFTLVELMIVVAIVGVLAALGVTGTRRYLATARTAEAQNTVGGIARNAVMQFETEYAAAEAVAEGSTSTQTVFRLCQSAAAVPDTLDKVRGVKYQPTNVSGLDFGIGNASTGWQCLAFSITTPIYYQYDYNQGSGYVSIARGAPDPGANGFEAVAIGDLDGDTQEAMFARNGMVNGRSIRLTTRIFTVDEFE
ncbi:MAG: prepilin-type N-terminal cleavage/methylation domain-containing protein [Polyangiaceae bacterium]